MVASMGKDDTALKELPAKIKMRSILFGDGAAGYAMQAYANEEFRVECVAVREGHGQPFVTTWEMAGHDGEYPTYEVLRDAVNKGPVPGAGGGS